MGDCDLLTYAALFYGELVFAAFVSLTVGFYTIWTYRRSPRLIVIAALVQGTGVALALTTLAVQLVLFLGWQDILTDLRYTVTARNYAPDNAEFVSELRQFYESKNIVFWYNVQSDEIFVGILNSLRWIFRLVLQTATPFLTLIGFGMAVAALCGTLRPPGPQYSAPSRLMHRSRPFLCWCRFVSSHPVDCKWKCRGWAPLLRDGWRDRDRHIGRIRVLPLLAIALAFGLRTCAAWISISGTPPGLYRCVCASFFLLCIGLLILSQGEFYDQGAAVLWWKTLTPFPVWMAKVVVCAMAFAGCMLVLAGRRAALGRWHDVPSLVCPFLICGALGYMLIYKLSGGYVHSAVTWCGSAPFIIFHTEVFIALGLFAAIAMVLTFLGGLRKDFNNHVTRAVGVNFRDRGRRIRRRLDLVQSR